MHKSTYLHFLQLVVWSFTWSSLDSSWITSLSLLLASKRENLSELGGVQAFLWAIDWGFGRIGRHWGICWEQPSSTFLEPAKNWAVTKSHPEQISFSPAANAFGSPSGYSISLITWGWNTTNSKLCAYVGKRDNILWPRQLSAKTLLCSVSDHHRVSPCLWEQWGNTLIVDCRSSSFNQFWKINLNKLFNPEFSIGLAITISY